MRTVDIHQAARDGNVEAIQIFLKHGGNACDLDRYDCEPLYYAVKHDQYEAAQLLLLSGGDVNRNSKFRGDPIGAAVWNLNIRMIKLTAMSGADINRLRNGETPLDSLNVLRRLAKDNAEALARLDEIEELLISLGGRRSRENT